MNNPLISIIVPVYNAEKYVEICITSILNQTYKNIEIIAINDGSKDSSLKILEELEKKDSRVKVLNKENSGVSSTRNLGLNHSSGEYVSFIDSDDWIEEDLYSTMISKMQENNCDCGMFEYFIDFPNETTVHTHSANEVITNKEALLYTITPVNRFSCTKIFSRESITDVFFDRNIYVGEDTLFACTALKKSKKVYFSNKALYHYRQNIESATGSGYNLKFISVIDAYEKICNLVSDDEELYVNAKTELAVFLINNIVGLYKNSDMKEKRKSFIVHLRKLSKDIVFNKNIDRIKKLKIMLCSSVPSIYSFVIRKRMEV